MSDTETTSPASPPAVAQSADAPASGPQWYEPSPDQLIGSGHRVGDLLEAPNWRAVEQDKDYLVVEAPMPDHVLNPRGHLFGGFTPIYCDFMAIFVARQTEREVDVHRWAGWMATRDMRIEYLRPVINSPLRIEGRALHRGRKNHLVEVRFLGDEDELLVLSHVKMVEVPGPPPTDPAWEKMGRG